MFKKMSKILIMISLVFLFGCTTKTALAPSEFKIQMENNKYNVSNVTDSYNYDGLYKAYKASNKKYDIIYYKLNTVEQAIGLFESSQVSFNVNKINNSKKTNISSKHYSKYTYTNNGSYLLLSRIDNTVIYISSSTKYQSEIKRIVKRLGY